MTETDQPNKRYTSVQANLVECGNMGRMAFVSAEKGMGTIQLTSTIINGKVSCTISTGLY